MTQPECSPTKAQILKQKRFTDLAYRLHEAEHVTEEEAFILYGAAESIWDDAIHIAAPWMPLSSLCGNSGRNLAAFDGERPDGVGGCWTCLIAAEWLDKALAKEAEPVLA